MRRLVVKAVAQRGHRRQTRLRAVVASVLAFLDEEPGWARFLISESRFATRAVSERRQKALSELARALLLERQAEGHSVGWFIPSAELTAELVVGGIVSVLRVRLEEGEHPPFAELAPSLAAFVAAASPGGGGAPMADHSEIADEAALAARRLPVRTTYRTTRVLSAIGASAGLSNREIAEAAGLSDEGQTSKLLRRLERRGLVQNFGLGQTHGGANAWQLTPYGERVLDATRHSLVPGAGAVLGRRGRGAA